MDQPGDSIAQIALNLRLELVQAGLIAPEDEFERVQGGRTNLVWRVVGPGRALMCKLARPGRDTPLFPNLPDDEGAALRALARTGLAPRLRKTLETASGLCLIYDACPGAPWIRDAAPVGALLSRLHRIAPPDSLRRVPGESSAILAQGDAMLDYLANPGDLADLRPGARHASEGKAVFLHGDPVPGNIIADKEKVVLIDWQCPARGDPIHDLALFLSPAMQVLGRGAPLSPAERAAFLVGYDNCDAQRRLEIAEPSLSWRMAVYCVWRIERGHNDYIAALGAELEHLQQLC